MDNNNLIFLTNKLNEAIFNSAGSSKHSSLIQMLSGVVSKNSIANPALTDNGYVFFGRPKLNLQSSSVKQDRIMASLNTLASSSLAFAIRCYLDPIFAKRSDITKIAENSLLYSSKVPYIPILTNSLETLSGWSDPTMEVDTTEGGFHSENITIAKGHDDLNKTITLSAVFNETMGFPITNLFMLWFRWIHLSTRGVIQPYNKYIEEYKISYSCPIYRFRLDTSGRYISFWAKGTGCFPTTYPMSSIMEFNRAESRKLHDKCNVSMTVNFSEYMDIIILKEFNTWIKRACKDIESYVPLSPNELLTYQPYAIPYISNEYGEKELQWRVPKEFDGEPIGDILENIMDDIINLLKKEEEV